MHLRPVPGFLVALTLTGLLALAGCTPFPIYNSQRGVPTTARSSRPTPRIVQTPSGDPGANYRQGQVLTGIASYYGPDFHGRQTANGEIFDQNAMTCAHKFLPFNTMLQVTLVENGRQVTVRVNDRGPYVDDRIIDLSREAARRIGLLEMGTGAVRAEILSLGGE